MAGYVGLSPKDPNKYRGPNLYLSSVVTRNREPTGADYRQPETGKLYPVSSFWIVGKDPTSGVEGDLWYLSKIVANVAFWVKFGTGGGGPLLNLQVDTSSPPGTDPVIPDINGTITITGGQVAAASIGANVIQTNSLAANTFTIEIQRSSANAISSLLLNGVSHYDSAHFTVDANGFVSLVNGAPAVSFQVQAATPPGVNPVEPTGAGLVNVNGTLVAAHSVPIETHTRALNTLSTEVQIASAVAGSTLNANGMSHYNNAHFTVDANGFVSLIGGNLAIDSFIVDYEPISTLPPTDPGDVVPNPAGQVTMEGRHNVVVEQQTASPNNFEMRLYAPYWFEVTGTSVAAADGRPNFGYITNNVALVTIGLPTTIAVGQTFHICGKGTGGWRISQSANQQIHFGTLDTTSGVGGRLDSTSQYDTITMVCTVTDLEFTVIHSQGTITVT